MTLRSGAPPLSTGDLRDHSVSELIKRGTEDVTVLVKAELQHARTELTAKAKAMGIGAGVLAVAGLLLVGVYGALVATVVLAFDTFLAAWLAALVTAVVLLVAAGLAGVVGIALLKAGSPPVPTKTIDHVKEDIAWVRQNATTTRT